MALQRRPPSRPVTAALLLTLSLAAAALAVDDLDHLTLDPYIANAGEKPVLIEFFAPWCSHCRHFEAEYKQVARTLSAEAHVARVDGSAHRILTSRFRVEGFPSFYLIRAGKVITYVGPRSHDGLVSFVRTDGEAGGEGGRSIESLSASSPTSPGGLLSLVLDGLAGPLSLYWQGVRWIYAAMESLRVVAEGYRDRPFALFGIVFGASMGVVLFFAIIIYFVTKPSLPPPPRARAQQQQGGQTSATSSARREDGTAAGLVRQRANVPQQQHEQEQQQQQQQPQRPHAE